MSTFTRPSLSEILERIQADIDSRLEGAEARLQGSVLNVVSYVEAGAVHGLYGFLSWLSLQIFPDTAELEFLNRWGAIWGVTRRAAAIAEGEVTFTGLDGTVIVEGTLLQRADGEQFVTTEEVTIASLAAIAGVEAVIAGLAGNTDEFIELTFVTPIDGVESVSVVSTVITGGSDIESDSSYLARLLDRIQQPPHGGSANDYLQWMFEIPGVTRAWVYPLELGIGAVTVRFMMDDLYVDGIPLTADILEAQTYIDEKRPVTADVSVFAPIAVPLDFEIELNFGDTAAIRASIEANLRDLILRDSEPGGTIFLSRINEAISLAEGEFDHELIAPVADVTHTTGQIATMGTITWA